jgi:hypothetical protein
MPERWAALLWLLLLLLLLLLLCCLLTDGARCWLVPAGSVRGPARV